MCLQRGYGAAALVKLSIASLSCLQRWAEHQPRVRGRPGRRRGPPLVGGLALHGGAGGGEQQQAGVLAQSLLAGGLGVVVGGRIALVEPGPQPGLLHGAIQA